MNTLRTIFLMGFMMALMVAVGGLIGGKAGLMIAFVIAIVTNISMYWFSDSIAIKQAQAIPVTREEAPELYDIVENLCRKADLPVPRIFIAPDESPNAFATGRDPEHSAVAVTAGILRILNRQELEAVLAHELGHVRNRDVLICTMGAVMASSITMLAHFSRFFFIMGGSEREEREGFNPITALLMAVLAPIAAALINCAISRSREFEADATGARMCGHPHALASALAKLEQGIQVIPNTTINPAMGNMFTVRPDRGNWFTNLYSSHPPIPERIQRLEEMDVRDR